MAQQVVALILECFHSKRLYRGKGDFNPNNNSTHLPQLNKFLAKFTRAKRMISSYEKKRRQIP